MCARERERESETEKERESKRARAREREGGRAGEREKDATAGATLASRGTRQGGSDCLSKFGTARCLMRARGREGEGGRAREGGRGGNNDVEKHKEHRRGQREEERGGKETSILTHRHTDRHVYRQTHRHSDTQTCTRPDTGKKTDTRTDTLYTSRPTVTDEDARSNTYGHSRHRPGSKTSSEAGGQHHEAGHRVKSYTLKCTCENHVLLLPA